MGYRLGGLIDGGAYFRNFTVFLSLFRLWCKDFQCMNFLSAGTKKSGRCRKVAVSGGSECKGKTATTNRFGQLDPFV